MHARNPRVFIETTLDGDTILKTIERIGRVCYKSEDKITADSARKFVASIMDPSKRHESVIEHVSATCRFVVDRGISHEVVRHRIASFSQESTRYVNYSKEKFGSEITVITPNFSYATSDLSKLEEWMGIWTEAMEAAEDSYMRLIEAGCPAQFARSVLPNSTKTEIVVTANLREWRHIFALRAAKTAHPQMQQVMKPLLGEFIRRIPVLFDDLKDLASGNEDRIVIYNGEDDLDSSDSCG